VTQINGLQVAARTSSFSFKEHPTLVTVAHSSTSRRCWRGAYGARRRRCVSPCSSSTPSRDFTCGRGPMTGHRGCAETAKRDRSRSGKLTGSRAAWRRLREDRIGGSRNPAAFDAYLRAPRPTASTTAERTRSAVAAFTEAIRLDPSYALAFAGGHRPSIYAAAS